MKKAILVLASMALVLGAGFAFAVVNAVTPSTNDQNQLNGWAYVDVTPGIGEVTADFISTRNFYSCFEYRTDGDTSQVLSENGGNNYNTLVTDGLYPYVCEKSNDQSMIIPAYEYVEVRMVFGAETDERFDWTRFDVLQPVVPESKDDCKKGGWMTYTDPAFKNQGDCVSWVQSSPDAKGNRKDN